MLPDLLVPRGGEIADLYTSFVYNTLYIRLKLAGSSHIHGRTRRGLCLVYVWLGYYKLTWTLHSIQCSVDLHNFFPG